MSLKKKDVGVTPSVNITPGSRIAVAAGAGGIGLKLIEALQQQKAEIAVLDLESSLTAADFSPSILPMSINDNSY